MGSKPEWVALFTLDGGIYIPWDSSLCGVTPADLLMASIAAGRFSPHGCFREVGCRIQSHFWTDLFFRWSALSVGTRRRHMNPFMDLSLEFPDIYHTQPVSKQAAKQYILQGRELTHCTHNQYLIRQQNSAHYKVGSSPQCTHNQYVNRQQNSAHYKVGSSPPLHTQPVSKQAAKQCMLQGRELTHYTHTTSI